jgi:hypothetical protein
MLALFHFNIHSKLYLSCAKQMYFIIKIMLTFLFYRRWWKDDKIIRLVMSFMCINVKYLLKGILSVPSM